MSDLAPGEVGLDPRKILESLDPAQVGVALSKLVAASIGDLVVVLSRSPAHKHYSLADIEWMVLPPVAKGQFYVVETSHKESGFRTPIALVTWAFVSDEVDRRLAEGAGRRVRLHPDEWRSGQAAWIIDIAGSAEGVRAAVQQVLAAPLSQRSVKAVVTDSDGKARVRVIDSGTFAAQPKD